MRQLHSRWILFAGTLTASLVAFGFPALAATTDTAALATPSITQQATAGYVIDGYQVTYLPSGLTTYSAHWKSIRKGGDRFSSMRWMNGTTVYGAVEVHRHAAPRTLAKIRETSYSDLTALRRTTVNGHPAYLSAADGTVFWLDDRNVALSVFLHPTQWSAEELLKVAEGIQRREGTESTFAYLSTLHASGRSVTSLIPGSAAEHSRLIASASTANPQESEEEQPRLLPAPADAPLYPSSYTDSLETEILARLSDEAGMSQKSFL